VTPDTFTRAICKNQQQGGKKAGETEITCLTVEKTERLDELQGSQKNVTVKVPKQGNSSQGKVLWIFRGTSVAQKRLEKSEFPWRRNGAKVIFRKSNREGRTY